MSEWISVRERLPEGVGRYLITWWNYKDNKLHVAVDHYLQGIDHTGMTAITDPALLGWFDYGSTVTHWMPLPDPPKED